MEIDEYISNLRNNNIIISVQDGRIAVNASDEAITPEVIKELTAKKQEILDFFKSIKETKKIKSIALAPKQMYYPLSSAQRRMFFLYEFDKEGTSYNMPGFYRVGRALNISKLEQTFKELVSRHGSLRTVFDIVDGLPVQRVLDSSSFELSYGQGAASEIDSAIADFVRPFDLSKDYPIRVSLMDVSREDYLLMIDMHHIINDGVSSGILMRDFWSLYHGYALPELRIQYVDYAVWQQSDAHKELVLQHKEYWLNKYSDEHMTLELPTDYSRPPHPSNTGEVHFLNLSKAQSDKLRSLASSQGVTMYSLFLSIYNVLLSKLSNQEDIVVGTPTAGRHHADLEGLVGMFVNTLALRNQVGSDVPFRDFLVTVQEDTLEAFDHQLYQYEELVDTLDLSRDAGRNPLFDVFFSYGQKASNSDMSNESDLKMRGHNTAHTIAKFDLSLDVLDAEEISLSFNYRTDLFESSSIARFSGYLQTIIDTILSDATQLISDIDILLADEKEQLLVEFNDTAVDYNLEQTVLDLFMEQAIATPKARAIVFGEESLSYWELNDRSDLWAIHLIQSGIVPGAIVGLLMRRSNEMITAILAVMKAGGAYLPINPDQPPYRTRHMLEDCGVTTIVGNLPLDLEELSGYNVLDIAVLDSAVNNSLELPYVSASDLAYIIYTSGSTGQPKGVMIEHESVTNLIHHERDFLGVDATDRILQFSPYYFDVSVEQIWLALTTGSSLVLVDKETLMDSKLFTEYLRRHTVTHLNVTPSFLESLSLPYLDSLKRIVVSGEACKPALAKRYSKDYEFYNEYGPTEATVISISQPLNKANLIGDSVPIGKPIANTQAYILDDHLNVLPQGVSGELYLGGKGLAKGYLNRPELTQDRFIDNPFGEGLMYKTGDLARWLSDGTIEYVGRNDHQVKIRGYRIELGEIESQLEAIDSISQALVVAHGSNVNKQLIGYLCSDGELDGADIKGLLSSKLPDYMVPTSYVWLDSFPLNANGKVDTRALPSPDLTAGDEFVAPQTENQQQLVAIWSEVLNTPEDKISITSDFFRLGGHSLLAITLTNKISQVFNVEVALRDLFVHRTIVALSAHLLGLDQVRFESIPKAIDRNYYPLSSAQRRMYFLYEFDKAGTSYNMPGFYRVNRGFDISRLEHIYKKLVNRHKGLRTIFELVDGRPVQRVLDGSSFELSYNQGAASDIDTCIGDFVRPFDLSKDYPIRVSLMDVTGEDYLLMVDIHHIVNDGVSNEILMRDFWSLYHGYALPELGIQYVDYAVWQQSAAHQELVSRHKEYWLARYSEELTTLELPTDYPRSLQVGHQGDVHSISLSKSQSSKLRSLASSEGVTMYTLFLGIYNVLLSKLSNQSDIAVGTPTAGRHHADLEGLVGMFVNTLALRNRVGSDVSFRDYLVTLQEDTLEAFDHQLYPYEELVDALDVSRDSGRNPLFDVFYAYDRQSDTSDSVGSEPEIRGHEVEYTIAKFDLSLDVLDAQEISFTFNYRTDLFKATSIERFSDYLVKIIEQVLQDKNIEIADIDILTTGEKNQILYAFNTPEVAYNVKGTIVDLIQEQVLRNPQTEAIYFNGYSLEYEELNKKVNQLTHYLLDVQSVQKGDRIGVYLGRSPEMLIAFLAILKSGATYVSLDPENPSDRINLLIEDSGMNFILTNAIADTLKITSTIKIVDLIAEAPEVEAMPADDPWVAIKGSDAAYVIFTSGSTGRPKGVVITHDALLDYSITFKEYFSLTSVDKVVQQASPAFDTVVEEVFPALLSGAAIVIVPEGGRNIDALVAIVEQTKATVLSTVPVVFDALNNYTENLKSLRVLISGGDLLLPRHIDKLIENYEIFNTYGPSESTVCISYHKISSLDNTSCIGKPIVNRQVYILDSNKQLCPVGVAGELCVSGKGLAKEYLNDIKLTNEKFIENPLIPGARMYCTGDAAKWNEDGTIAFLGRIDNQVKIRGVRIELGEIESRLEAIDSVSQALVVTHGSDANKQLVAYLCGDAELDGDGIKSLLSSKLPAYMIPTGYVWLNAFPLNANGKVDRRALPSPDLTAGEVYVAPENESQEKLVAIWSEVLGLESDKIGIDSDFFKLGGHSMLIMKLRHLMKQDFEVTLSISEIFLNPTIRSLDKKLKENACNEQKDNRIMPLNNIQGEENLFMIHDGSGEIDGYLELSRRIEGYSCYGIKFSGFNNMTKAPEIKEIASQFIKEIKTIQKVGPYHLLGWSLGGEIATEITLQLEDKGEKVEHLIIVDSSLQFNKPLETSVFDIASEISLFKSKFDFCITNEKTVHSLNELWTAFSASEVFNNESIGAFRKTIPDDLKQLIPDYDHKDKKELFDAINKIRVLFNASERYFVKTFIQAKTLYLWPTESGATLDKEKLKHFFVNFDLMHVSGNHFSVMKDPNVVSLSTIVNDRIGAKLVKEMYH